MSSEGATLEEKLNPKPSSDSANESGNLASILAQLNITLSALRDALKGAGNRDLSTLESDIESLTKALGSLAQDTVLTKQQDIDVLLRTLLNTPLARLAVDSAGRLRIIIDVAGVATPVTISSGTVTAVTTVGTLSAITTFPVDQRYEMIQRSNIEYNECQRSKFAFT